MSGIQTLEYEFLNKNTKNLITITKKFPFYEKAFTVEQSKHGLSTVLFSNEIHSN